MKPGAYGQVSMSGERGIFCIVAPFSLILIPSSHPPQLQPERSIDTILTQQNQPRVMHDSDLLSARWVV